MTAHRNPGMLLPRQIWDGSLCSDNATDAHVGRFSQVNVKLQ